MLGTLDGEIRWQFELCFKTHIPGKNQPNIMKSSGSLGEALAVGVLFGIVLLLVVTPIIYSGFKKRQRHQELSGIPVGLSDAVTGESAVVSGTVSSQSGHIESPYRSQNCALALWDMASLNRSNGTQWVSRGSGMTGNKLIITADSGHVPVMNISQCRNQTTTAQMIQSTLFPDATSGLAFLRKELRRASFERRFRPTDELPDRYRSHTQEIGFDRTTRESSDTLGTILAKLLIPSGTVRYRELTFRDGDEITVIGKRTRDGIAFEPAESIQPVVVSASLSSLLSRYRRQYLFQLYGSAAFVLLFSGLIGYLVYS
jgi:hypothetical protein